MFLPILLIKRARGRKFTTCIISKYFSEKFKAYSEVSKQHYITKLPMYYVEIELIKHIKQGSSNQKESKYCKTSEKNLIPIFWILRGLE